MRRYSHAELYLLQRLLIASHDPWRHYGRRVVMSVGYCLKRRKAFADQIGKLLVIQVPGSRDDHVVRRKALPVKLEHALLIKRAYRFLGTQDRLAQRMVFPEILGEDLMHQVIGIVLIHLDFFQDYALFPGDIFHRERWVQNQVAQYVDRNRQVLVEDFNVEANGLLAGK